MAKTQEQEQNQNKDLQFTLENAFGVAAYLASRTVSHKFLFAQDFEWLITPAITLNQYKIYRQKDNNNPLAFVSFANITEEVEKRILSGNRKLAPQDWNAGNKLYLIDIISPYLSQKDVLEQLAKTDFADKDLFLTRIKGKNEGLETVRLADLLAEFKKQEEEAKAATKQ